MSKARRRIFLCILLATQAAVAEVIVHAAWMREVPPTSAVGAVYLDVENRATEPCAITAVSAPAPYSVALHESVISGDRVRMQGLRELPLKAAERLRFTDSGQHLMVDFGGQPAPRVGSRLTLELKLCDGAVITVQAEVRADDGGGNPHHEHLHH